MPEYHINNLSGWAGDLQTLMKDTYDRINGSKDYNEFYNAFYNLIGEASFSMEDMYADTDAYNIYKMLTYYSLTDALKNYYQRDYEERFSKFTNYWSKAKIKDCVSIYTDNDYIVIHWPLFGSYNFSKDQSQAATDAFVDFLMEKIESE